MKDILEKCVECRKEFKKNSKSVLGFGSKRKNRRPAHAVTCSKKCSRIHKDRINKLPRGNKK